MLCMQVSGKNDIIFFAYSNMDASLVPLLVVLFIKKRGNWQLILLPSYSAATADQIIPCQISLC